MAVSISAFSADTFLNLIVNNCANWSAFAKVITQKNKIGAERLAGNRVTWAACQPQYIINCQQHSLAIISFVEMNAWTLATRMTDRQTDNTDAIGVADMRNALQTNERQSCFISSFTQIIRVMMKTS